MGGGAWKGKHEPTRGMGSSRGVAGRCSVRRLRRRRARPRRGRLGWWRASAALDPWIWWRGRTRHVGCACSWQRRQRPRRERPRGATSPRAHRVRLDAVHACARQLQQSVLPRRRHQHLRRLGRRVVHRTAARRARLSAARLSGPHHAAELLHIARDVWDRCDLGRRSGLSGSRHRCGTSADVWRERRVSCAARVRRAGRRNGRRRGHVTG